MPLAIERAQIPTRNDAGIDAARNRVAEKNGYQSVRGNCFVKRDWLTRFISFSSKGRQNQTSARAFHESSHAVTAALLRVQHQIDENPEVPAEEKSVWQNIKNNSYLQSRLKRQDHVRFRTDLQSTNSTDKNLVNGAQARRNRISRIFARASHICTGLCELTSAPTGFTFKALRNLFFQGVEENGLTNMAATGVASLGIGVCATTIQAELRQTATQGGNLAEHAASALISFAAFSGTAGGLSALCTGMAALTAPDIEVNDHQRKILEQNMVGTLTKINDLVLKLKEAPDGIQQLARALNRKIPASAREDVQEGQKHAVPTLLHMLLEKLAPENSDADRAHNLEIAMHVVGQYMNTAGTLDKDKANCFQRHAHRQKIRNLEKHFMALAGMVEHVSIPNTSQNAIKKDARLVTEEKAKDINRGVWRALSVPAKGIDHVFGTQLKQRLESWASASYLADRSKSLKQPDQAQKNHTHSEYMLSNMHQYGRITRFFMKTALFIHSVNYHYILAVNAQSSRVYGNLTKAADEALSTNHPSRLAHAGVGRFLGGASVSAMYAFGVAGVEHFASHPASFALGEARFSIFNTGTMMTGVGLLSAAAMLCAKWMVGLEGWAGPIAHTADRPGKQVKTKCL